MTAISLLGFGQYNISGVVMDAQGQPLEGATVRVMNTNLFGVSDALGHFHLQKVQRGDQTVIVRFLGYKNLQRQVVVDHNLELELSLEEDVTITDEVIVEATRASGKTPTTYSNVNRQEIQEHNFGQDLPYLLNWSPSVLTTSDAGAGIGYTGIRIRGSDATRVNVTVNGIPYNDSESMGTYWVDIPDIASSSENIQVQRGVGTSTNGAGAFGATINLQTLAKNAEPYAEIVNTVGSFGTHRHTLGTGSGLLRGHWTFDGRVSKIASDGFIDRASSDLKSYYMAGGYYGQKTILKAIAFGGQERTYQSWYGVPESRLENDGDAMMTTAANEGWNEEQTQNLLNSGTRTFNPYLYGDQVDDYKQDHYQLHFSSRPGSAWTANVSLHYTYGRGFYEEYKYGDAFSDYGLGTVTIGDSVISSSDLIRRRWLDNDFYGTVFSVEYERNALNITVGGGWNRYDGDHFGNILWAQVTEVPKGYRYYYNNGIKEDFNVYGKMSYAFNPKLNAFVDLQYRGIDYTMNGIENEQNAFDLSAQYDFFNPKAGLVYNPSIHDQVYASMSIGNKEPVRDDFIDNPASFPKYERLRDYEVGYRISSDLFLLSLDYYFMDYANQLVLTGEINDVGEGIRTNVADSYRTGVELEGVLRISEKLQWRATATFSQNKIASFTQVLYDYGVAWDEFNTIERTYTETDISFSPSLIASSVITVKPFRNARITLLSKGVGKQYLDNTSNEDRRIDQHLVNDLRLGYEVQPDFMKEVRLQLLVNNIFDVRYESNGYTWGYLGGGEEFRENYYFPQAGRNYMLMLTMHF